MKKRFLTMLVLLLTLALTLILVSCSDTEGDNDGNESSSTSSNNSSSNDSNSDNDTNNGSNSGDNAGDSNNQNGENSENSPQIKLTRDEWIAAFELDGIDSLEYSANIVFDKEDPPALTGIFKFNQDLGFYTLEDGKNRVTEYAKVPNGYPVTLMDCIEILNDVGDEIQSLITSYLDYGYAQFKYSSANDCYTLSKTTYQNEYSSETLTVNLYFDNNKLVSRIDCYSSYGDCVDSARMDIYNYNKTALSIPTDKVSKALNELFPIQSAKSIKDTTSDQEFSDSEAETILAEINSLIASIDLSCTSRFSVMQKGSYYILTRLTFDFANPKYINTHNGLTFSKLMIYITKDDSGYTCELVFGETTSNQTVRLFSILIEL